MISIAIELLTGRYSATAFDDRDATEWPPHPGRLFSALVAAWGDVDEPDVAEHEALAWLETLAQPTVSCSETHQVAERAGVTVFVPVNDPTALTRDVHGSGLATLVEAEEALVAAEGDRGIARAQEAMEKALSKVRSDAQRAGVASGRESDTVVAAALQVLPENREKQARTFPTVVPQDSTIWISWPAAEPPSAHVAALDRLCGRVARIGHSSTFVACRVETDQPPPPSFQPKAGTGRFLRVMRPGLLDALDDVFGRTEGSTNGPLPRVQVEYAEGAETGSLPEPPLLGGDWFVWAMPTPFRDSGPAVLRVTRALDLTRAVRGALVQHSVEPVPEILLGHPPGARRSGVSQRPHAAIVALPNVGHRQSDGSILGVAVVLPKDLLPDERDAVEDAIRAWGRSNSSTVSFGGAGAPGMRIELGAPRIDPAPSIGSPWIDIGAEQRSTLRRSTWCRASTTWTTVTPVALDRFPGDIGSTTGSVRDAALAEAAATVARACTYAGLPRPAIVEVDRSSFLAAVPAAGGRRRGASFPTFRAGSSSQQRLGLHARIEFAEPVAGPVLLGAGRYLGFGLCTPLRAGR